MPITIIETPRCDICLLAPEDHYLLDQYYRDNRQHLLPWEPTRDPEYFSEYGIKMRIKNALLSFKQQSGFHFVVLTKNNDEVIAICNFSNIVRGSFDACHLGYAVSHQYQGQGYMQESLEAAIEYVFNKFKLHRIMANYIPENERSGKLLSRLGFEKEGYARNYLKIAGKWQDHVLTAKINPRVE